MEKQNMILYLRAIKALEEDIYIRRQVMDSFVLRRSLLCKEINILQPMQPSTTEISLYSTIKEILHNKMARIDLNVGAAGFLGLGCGTVILAVIVGLIVNYVLHIPMTLQSAIITTIALLILIPLIGISFVSIYEGINTQANKYEEQERRAISYESEMIEYKAALDKERLRISSEKRLRDSIDISIRHLSSELSELSTMLHDLYNKNIVNPKFRNLEAITHILNYIESEIVYQLDGPQGAYAEYLHEQQLGKIVKSINALQYDLVNRFENVTGFLTRGLDNLSAKMDDLTRNSISSNTYLNSINTQMKTFYQELDPQKINESITQLNKFTKTYENDIDEFFRLTNH